MEIIVIVAIGVMLAAGLGAIIYATVALVRSERKRNETKTVITSSIGFFDEVTAEHENCRVTCLRNSMTGQESFSWSRRPTPIFVCDRRKCENCDPEQCSYTSDVEHAVNFHRDGAYFVENE